MRGFFQAQVLERVLPYLGRQGEGAFDLVAGTSTGGITALGLAVPEVSGRHRTPGDIASFYRTHGPQIFPRSSCRNLAQWVRSKHRRLALDSALREAFVDQLLSAADMRRPERPESLAVAEHADLSQSRTDLSPEDRLRSIHSFPRIWVLSIGTGRTPPNSRWRRGRLGFALGLPHAFMYPSALTAEFAVQSMADVQEVTAGNQFGRVFAVLRVDPPESMAQLPLDAATPAAFDEMERAADEALGDTSFIIDFAMFAAASRL